MGGCRRHPQSARMKGARAAARFGRPTHPRSIPRGMAHRRQAPDRGGCRQSAPRQAGPAVQAHRPDPGLARSSSSLLASLLTPSRHFSGSQPAQPLSRFSRLGCSRQFCRFGRSGSFSLSGQFSRSREFSRLGCSRPLRRFGRSGSFRLSGQFCRSRAVQPPRLLSPALPLRPLWQLPPLWPVQPLSRVQPPRLLWPASASLASSPLAVPPLWPASASLASFSLSGSFRLSGQFSRPAPFGRLSCSRPFCRFGRFASLASFSLSGQFSRSRELSLLGCSRPFCLLRPLWPASASLASSASLAQFSRLGCSRPFCRFGRSGQLQPLWPVQPLWRVQPASAALACSAASAALAASASLASFSRSAPALGRLGAAAVWPLQPL